jgi:DNA repair exonuclease SbcCD ATPase subunit
METCPICGEQFDSPLKLSNHLKKSDEKHQFLKYAIKKFKKKASDYQEVYDNYITFFDDFTTLQEAEDKVESYLNQKKEEEKQRKEQLKREKRERLEAERELKRQERERLKQEKQARLEAEREEKRR